MSGAPRQLLGVPAPAKVNLFLHVLGRRPDGYHEIQSVFAPIGLQDLLDFESCADGRIERRGDLTGALEQDLPWRAAQALREHARAAGRDVATLGARIDVAKRIPVGAGLGGGSSDAAASLLALNRLWDLDLPRAELASIGRRLGADVPFFLGRGPAFVEGIGERLAPLPLPPAWLVLVFPQVAVSTAEIFSDPKLTRNTKPTTIAGFSAALSSASSTAGEGAVTAWPARPFGVNDLEAIARAKVPAIEEALRLLGQFGGARMSGSGSAVFLICAQQARAVEIASLARGQAPAHWAVWTVPLLEELPLADW
jgi:4-diphosphocytidyl-2-C-methyl-D-erythritol kinase